MKLILFQGDSITDAGRPRDNDDILGFGYPALVKGSLSVDHPGELSFLNRGVSGDRIVDIYARMKKDILNLKPDVMSILVGINDVWHEMSAGNGVDEDKFYKVYSMLIDEIQEALPDTKIMIMGAFALKAGRAAEVWYYVNPEVKKRVQKARLVAEEHGLVFVPLQEVFDEASKICPPEYWSKDGVHPTTAGHELIKREWIKAYETKL